MEKTVRWGVLGTAKIALDKVIPGIGRARGAVLQAIASRRPEAAEEAARRFGFKTAHGSYEALLADPDVDAVYIPLPNHLHAPWAVKALEAGKHVLCEKPVALTAAEAETLLVAREKSGAQILEAFMVRQHPQWLRVRELVSTGAIGEVKLIRSAFTYFNDDPANVRNQPGIGGGALYDVGCYALVFARLLFGTEPRRAFALFDHDPAFGTDRLASAILDFGEGRHLQFSVGTQLVRFQTTDILGTKARISVPVSLNAPQNGAVEILVDEGGAVDGSQIRRERIEPCDQYALQAETAGAVFSGQKAAEFPIEDAVANMKALDALFRSGTSGRWEEV
ncbi:Gfo/Idh/MocA family protein [Aureimonas psammosilenae]|uniref:Gfo/Idh/MocA family protein n=1 Tax=Aureimonas psammosilenae TaxID=2495496 RepID=UPI001260D493|nr:Gfo/Idh/MocA family oxidoreductase [Aureimonas psammosilenae]